MLLRRPSHAFSPLLEACERWLVGVAAASPRACHQCAAHSACDGSMRVQPCVLQPPDTAASRQRQLLFGRAVPQPAPAQAPRPWQQQQKQQQQEQQQQQQAEAPWQQRQHHHHQQQPWHQQQQQQQGQQQQQHHHHHARGARSRHADHPRPRRPRHPCEAATDLTDPASWYPQARATRRTLEAHLGPTNSGKTHAALTALKASRSGLYVGPLRLLAAEVADRLNAAGIPCDLVTGQEVVRVPGARHVAATVEMADLEAPVETAVLDEVQMLGDAGRGWAWTRALLGLPAATLHVCGDPSALPLLQQLAAQCGDELRVTRCRRLTPLVVEADPVGGVAGLRSGDCVIAFSRRWLHRLRRRIGGVLGRHVGMVYGGLPPEARRSQAGRFNDSASSGVELLVASDAVGMGLNLNIRRVVFATLHKFDGADRRLLSPSEVKQIAGRAGRYCSGQPQGYVAVMEREDLPHLQAALLSPTPDIKAATLLPRFDQLAAWSMAAGCSSLEEALTSFAGAARLAPPFALADLRNVVGLARLLRHLEAAIAPEDLYTFCTSPASVDDGPVAGALLAFASAYARAQPVGLDELPAGAPQALLLAAPPASDAALTALEELSRVCDLYLWLAGRFPGSFPHRRAALRARARAAQLVDQGLDIMGRAAAAAAAAAAGHVGGAADAGPGGRRAHAMRAGDVAGWRAAWGGGRDGGVASGSDGAAVAEEKGPVREARGATWQPPSWLPSDASEALQQPTALNQQQQQQRQPLQPKRRRQRSQPAGAASSVGWQDGAWCEEEAALLAAGA